MANEEEKAWLTLEEAAQLIRDLYKTSGGSAKARVRAARKSGEVDCTINPLWAVAMDESLPITEADILWDKADLLDWLRRNPPQVTTERGGDRYDGDKELVAEAIQGIREGIWRNAHQAAKAIAARKPGPYADAAVQRLRKKISEQIGN